jgi:hypothetical protein
MLNRNSIFIHGTPLFAVQSPIRRIMVCGSALPTFLVYNIAAVKVMIVSYVAIKRVQHLYWSNIDPFRSGLPT